MIIEKWNKNIIIIYEKLFLNFSTYDIIFSKFSRVNVPAFINLSISFDVIEPDVKPLNICPSKPSNVSILLLKVSSSLFFDVSSSFFTSFFFDGSTSFGFSSSSSSSINSSFLKFLSVNRSIFLYFLN
jgi:hypothetical protein